MLSVKWIQARWLIIIYVFMLILMGWLERRTFSLGTIPGTFVGTQQEQVPEVKSSPPQMTTGRKAVKGSPGLTEQLQIERNNNINHQQKNTSAVQTDSIQEREIPAWKARLASVKSAEELMVLDKKIPMLNEDISKLKSVSVTATGYYAGYESTGKNPGNPQYGLTFSGVRVKRGIYSTVAADPRVFPIGTQLYIPGYGYAVVADTGSAIKGKKIDLYFDTKADIYREWGKKEVRVYIIKRGYGSLTQQEFNHLNNAAYWLRNNSL